MPKQKTKSSVTKRFKKTKNGKITRGQANTSHLFASKTTKSKRQARKKTTVSNADAKRYKDVM